MLKLRPGRLTVSQLLYVGVLLFALFSLTVLAVPFRSSYAAEAEPGVLDLSGMPLAFIANEGQTDPDVAYHVSNSSGSLFFTPREVVFSLPMTQESAYVVHMDFIGADTAAIRGFNKQAGIVNYFIGNDPSDWHTHIATYGGVHYDNLYPGIDLRFEGTYGTLKGTYTVTPLANPSLIRWQYTNAEQVTLDPQSGNLQIALYDDAELGQRTLAELAPIAWQDINGERVAVDVQYTLNEAGEIAFAVGEYDPHYTLVIDPEIQYSTYIGGNEDDLGYDVTLDNAGNAYLTGVTQSLTFPRSAGAYQTTLKGGTDAFVTKLNVSISSQKIVYSTYLGGISVDEGHDISIDSTYNAYVTGVTTSNNFPGTPPLSYNGAKDAFVAKLNSSGTALVYARYLGGSGDDFGDAIEVNAAGQAYVSGWTESSNFPVNSAVQPSLGGGRDAFITKFSPDGSSRLFSTYLGGVGTDEAKNVFVDATDQVYIAGSTDSLNFPVVFAFQTSYGGGTSDGFLTKMASDGTYVYSTFFGGSNGDALTSVAVDDLGDPYIVGWTASTSATFPVSAAPLQAENAGGEDAFLVQLNAAADTVLYGTFLGGGGPDKASDLTLDQSGVVHITGITASSDFPLTDPFDGQAVFNGGASDVFVTAIDVDSGTFFYSSYVGGGAADVAEAIGVDPNGGIYVIGHTTSTDFPEIRGAFQRGGTTGYEGFLFKIGSAQADLTITKFASSPEVLLEETVVYTIEVVNQGPDETESVVVEDTIPPEITVDSYSTTKGVCTRSGDVLTCTIGAMAPSETVTITVNATGTTIGEAVNTATITQSSQFDPNTPNTSTATVLIYKDSDLGVDKTADLYRVLPGAVVRYKIEVTNYGPAPSNGVTLTETLPPSSLIQVETFTVSKGSFSLATGIWTIGDMARDEVATLTITATVNDTLDVGTVIINTVDSLTGSEGDPLQENNSDVVEIVVVSELFPAYGCMPSETDPDVITCITGSSD